MRFRLLAGLVAVGVIIMTLTASASCDEKGLGDAPVGEQHEVERQVWLAPDQFPNISAWCIGKDGIYVSTRPHYEVVPNDPNCAEGGILRGSGE